MVSGICVFDIDGTLKPKHGSKDESVEEVRRVVQRCRALNMGIGINTARVFMTGGLKKYLRSLHIDVDTLPPGAVQWRAYTSSKKVGALSRIADAYGGVPRSRIFFFDDRKKNVDKATAHGFVGVHVPGNYVKLEIGPSQLQLPS